MALRLSLPLRRVLALAGLVAAGALVAAPPAVRECALENGLRVLVVERPGSGALSARCFVRAGRMDTGTLPPAAADLLARCVFGRPLPEDLACAPRLEDLLRKEEGARQAMGHERQRRLRGASGSGPSPEDLARLHEPLYRDLSARVLAVEAWDALDALGATRREIRAAADHLSFGLDLPAASLAPWLALERARLAARLLGRYPVERDRFPRSAEAPPPGWAATLHTALPGQAAARVLEPSEDAVGALSWSELRAWADQVLRPERMVLVLVGDIRLEQVLPLLRDTLGLLERGTEGGDRPPESTARTARGARRLQVTHEGAPGLFMAWLMPPLAHPDRPLLELLAELLGRHPQARLRAALTGPGGPAAALQVDTGVPAGRAPGLLLLHAEPQDGRTLGEMEQTILGEVLRIQRQGPTDSEVRMARARLLQAQDACQDDAARLAWILGEAEVQGGDWRLAFRSPGREGPELRDRLQRTALDYLKTDRSTVALLEPDPLNRPRDAQERRAAAILQRLLKDRLDGPHADSVLREALQQIRLLPRGERERLLTLLESQVTE